MYKERDKIKAKQIYSSFINNITFTIMYYYNTDNNLSLPCRYIRSTSGTPWTVHRVFATSSGIRIRIRFALTSAQQRTGNPRKSLSDNVTKRLCDAFSSSREGSHVYTEISWL